MHLKKLLKAISLVSLLALSAIGQTTNYGAWATDAFTNLTPMTTLTITNSSLSATNGVVLRLEGILDMGGNDITNIGAQYSTITTTTYENAYVTNFVVEEEFTIGGETITNLTDGVPTYETDPVWNSASNLYATGTPVYVESDPVWVAASSLYYTASASDALFATGTPVYVSGSSDWLAGGTQTGGLTNEVFLAGNGEGLTNILDSGLLACTNLPTLNADETFSGDKSFSGIVSFDGPVGGTINMSANSITNVNELEVDLFTLGTEAVTNWDDVCVFLPGAWVGAYVTNPIGTTCSNEFVFMLDEFANNAARGFGLVGSNITFQGNAGTGVFEIAYSGSFTSDTAGVTGFVGIRKNEILQAQFTRREYMKLAGYSYGIAGVGIVNLISNDTIDIVVKSDSAADVVLVPLDFTTIMKRLGTY